MNIEPLFEDTIKAAYHLALLDEPYSQRVEWLYHHNAEGRADSAAALYDLGRPMILFLLGEADGLEECLAGAELPEYAYVAYFPEHAGVVHEAYSVPRPLQMQRMVLGRDAFRAAAARQAPNACDEAVVLGDEHLPLLEKLFSSEPGFRHDPYQYACGGYVGILGDGRLLAAAGTHFVSEENSFAMIGNVLTRPGHRRLGLATRVVACLLSRLFDRVETVCLNVGRGNAAAVKMYEPMGFATHCVYSEGAAVLRKVAASAV
jgi:ribosomal protein S18 acetylase RimI-like enzyme